MYNNIVYQVFQDLFYDTSASTNYINTMYNNEANENQETDISSTDTNLLSMYYAPNRRFNNTNISNSIYFLQNENYSFMRDSSDQNILNDISFITIRLLNNYYRNIRSNNTGRVSLSWADIVRNISNDYGSEDTNFLDNFINSTFENNNKKFKKVISDHELEKLTKQKFVKENETTTNSQCPIYCYNFEENEEIIKLSCNHNFNCEAITRWLTEESNTCPICRYEFDYKEINNDTKRQSNEEMQSNEERQSNEEMQANINDDEYNSINRYNASFDYDYDFPSLIEPVISQDEMLLQEILLYSYNQTQG